MNLVLKFQLLAVLLFVLSCTGQKPAPIKNSTNTKVPIKASCSDLKLEGQVLSKKNIENIFDCSGWSKAYPALLAKIKSTDQAKVDHVFEIFNQKLFTTVDQRKKAFQFVITAEDEKYLDNVSYLIEKALYDHNFLAQLDLVLNSTKVSDKERSSFMKVLSDDNSTNLKNIKSLARFSRVFEKYKSELKRILEVEDDATFRKRLVVLLNDLASSVQGKDWKHLSGLLYHQQNSALKDWAAEGANQNLNNLLQIIKAPEFKKDVTFLHEKLQTGVSCENLAGAKNYSVNLGQELKHKIESLKNDSYEDFEKTLLHGFSKFAAFRDFCQDKKTPQGLNAFARVLDYCFRIIPAEHDYNFLKNIHKIFGEDRFVLLGFLSSESFSSLQGLFLNLEERDQDLVRTLFYMLNEVSEEDLKNFAAILSDFSQDKTQSQEWHSAWASIWQRLSPDEKEDFINFLSVLADDNLRGDLAVGFVADLFEQFPDLSGSFSQKLSSVGYQNDLRFLIAELSDREIQKDLSHFLSDKGIFEFLKILTYSPESRPTKAPRPVEDPILRTYVANPLNVKMTKTRVCYEELSEKYQQDSSYYSLVVQLPEVCRNVLGEVGFVGQIYLWMNNSHRYFNERYGINDFHGSEGVWAPGMLHFIFSAAINADLTIKDRHGNAGIKNNIAKIHKEATQVEVLEAFHLISKTYVTASHVVPFESNLEAYFSKISDQERTKIFSDVFQLVENKSSQYVVESKPISCKQIDSKLGANPCLENKVISDKLADILRIAKRKFDKNPSLIEELVKWLHPKGGISLPFRWEANRKHHTSIEEIIRFVYDLSAQHTIKDFTYTDRQEQRAVSGDTLSRLEVVIRDISFNNNFYGAYFKNEVAAAGNYRPEVAGSEKLLKWLGRLSGPLRNLGGMDKDSKWRLKNVRETFSSLVEISDEYPQADGKTKTYNEFIQSLLAAIAQSSRPETQNFNAYRLPKDELAEGHNGLFLTRIVEISGLRHLASFVRSRFGDLSSLKSQEFQKINSQLIGRHDLSVIQSGLQNILDKYLDADRNQLNLMISDAVQFTSSLKPEEQKYLEESLLKMLVLLSNEKVSTKRIQKLASGLELVVKMWPEVREILKRTEDKKQVLKLVNELMDSLVSNPQEVDNLLKVLLESEVASIKDFEKLLLDPAFRHHLAELLNYFSTMNLEKSELNWIATFKAIFANKDLRFAPVVNWMKVSMKQKPADKLTVSVLLDFLGEKNGDEYRLKAILDEFFINHSAELHQFISETFPALEIKN